jgi:hypothetical protein
MEREADRIGFGVATQAGFEPQGFVTHVREAAAGRAPERQRRLSLPAHAPDDQRAQRRHAVAPAAGRPRPVQPTLEHAMAAARAGVSQPRVDALRGMVPRRMRALAALPRARQANVLYAATLAASRLRDRGRHAACWAARAAGGGPMRPANARPACWARRSRWWQATRPGPCSWSTRSPTTGRDVLLAAQAQVQTGAGAPGRRPAADLGGRPSARRRRQAAAVAGLCRRRGSSCGRCARIAEARAAQLDFTAALDRFKAAQDLVRKGGTGADHIEASIIDSRTRAVESLLREQALER